ncbi:hypothetical protein [Sphaerisporangium corydalis]|uniref:Uncharacterized protein n=1 Tax=Sphaerisporangium corydalis TaxID=1441875 RepID=A0ABV9ERR3_9ACTN|nr:hypothetical protein [Sphaerisporangium corydalis]
MGSGSMTRVIERADQLVLEFVSKVADASHGVLRTEQRLDFVGRLRSRIEEERRGSADLAAVRKVIAMFGEPSALLQREIQRLAAAEQEAARRSRETQATTPPPVPRPVPRARADAAASAPRIVDDYGDSATEVFPAVDTEGAPAAETEPPRQPRPSRAGPPLPRGSAPLPRNATFGPPPRKGPFGSAPRKGPSGSAPVRRPSGSSPLERPSRPVPREDPFGPVPREAPVPIMTRLRRAAMAGANPMATDGRDARTILLNDRREVAAMALLTLAALLIPFPLPNVAIFPLPVLVWAVGALTVLACEGWIFRDRMTGLMAPIAAYLIGGVALGALKAPETAGGGLQAFVDSFWQVSGLMFMLGTAGGVLWLAYRLFNPPPPPPRRGTLGTAR